LRDVTATQELGYDIGEVVAVVLEQVVPVTAELEMITRLVKEDCESGT
jgi:hypothetical protein